ncbi:MAG: hypothetical protein K8I02_08220, partial [Candidatus Methylomirabilis sp.]|nr:hypothetical protein [Deltaproteobacteria bacterium]
FLYFAVLGANPLDFEPGETRVTEFLGAGEWTPSEHVYEDGFIPWRAKVVGGTPYVVGYIGGENIYDFNAEPIDVHFLTTANGRDLAPAVPGKPVVLRGGCSETDFVVLDDGSLLAVSRNEASDELGWGMKICKAPANDWGTWLCVADPRKYDSPLLFKRGADVYLIGRRNLTETGNFDLGLRQYDRFLQTILYSLDYWGKGKRTSLWKVDPATLEVSFALDFPSRGDTSFAGLLEEADGTYTVYNYSSPPGEEEIGWLTGQLNPTEIYRIPLRLP